MKIVTGAIYNLLSAAYIVVFEQQNTENRDFMPRIVESSTDPKKEYIMPEKSLSKGKTEGIDYIKITYKLSRLLQIAAAYYARESSLKISPEQEWDMVPDVDDGDKYVIKKPSIIRELAKPPLEVSILQEFLKKDKTRQNSINHIPPQGIQCHQ